MDMDEWVEENINKDLESDDPELTDLSFGMMNLEQEIDNS